jgi:hypothetical protein
VPVSAPAGTQTAFRILQRTFFAFCQSAVRPSRLEPAATRQLADPDAARETGAASADAGSADAADAENTYASDSDAADTTPPVVISTNPANGAAGVSIAKILTATFSQPMDPRAINVSTFTLEQGTTPILGVVSAVGAIGTFIPASDLALNTSYTAAITTGAKHVAGNPIASLYRWRSTLKAIPMRCSSFRWRPR